MSHDSYPPAQVGSAVGLSASGSDCMSFMFFLAIVMGAITVYCATSTDESRSVLTPFVAAACLFFAACGALMLYVKIRRIRRH